MKNNLTKMIKNFSKLLTGTAIIIGLFIFSGTTYAENFTQTSDGPTNSSSALYVPNNYTALPGEGSKTVEITAGQTSFGGARIRTFEAVIDNINPNHIEFDDDPLDFTGTPFENKISFSEATFNGDNTELAIHFVANTGDSFPFSEGQVVFKLKLSVLPDVPTGTDIDIRFTNIQIGVQDTADGTTYISPVSTIAQGRITIEGVDDCPLDCGDYGQCNVAQDACICTITGVTGAFCDTCDGDNGYVGTPPDCIISTLGELVDVTLFIDPKVTNDMLPAERDELFESAILMINTEDAVGKTITIEGKTITLNTSVATDYCEPDTCNGNGTCDTNSSGLPVCACDDGYAAPWCETCAADYQDINNDGTCEPSCNNLTDGWDSTCGGASSDPDVGTCIINNEGVMECDCGANFQNNDNDEECKEACLVSDNLDCASNDPVQYCNDITGDDAACVNDCSASSPDSVFDPIENKCVCLSEYVNIGGVCTLSDGGGRRGGGTPPPVGTFIKTQFLTLIDGLLPAAMAQDAPTDLAIITSIVNNLMTDIANKPSIANAIIVTRDPDLPGVIKIEQDPNFVPTIQNPAGIQISTSDNTGAISIIPGGQPNIITLNPNATIGLKVIGEFTDGSTREMNVNEITWVSTPVDIVDSNALSSGLLKAGAQTGQTRVFAEVPKPEGAALPLPTNEINVYVPPLSIEDFYIEGLDNIVEIGGSLTIVSKIRSAGTVADITDIEVTLPGKNNSNITFRHDLTDLPQISSGSDDGTDTVTGEKYRIFDIPINIPYNLDLTIGDVDLTLKVMNSAKTTTATIPIKLVLEKASGDINGDGIITILDVFQAFRIMGGSYDPTETERKAANLDGSFGGQITIIDVALLYHLCQVKQAPGQGIDVNDPDAVREAKCN